MTTTLKGIFPDPKPTRRKNFIQENVKNLRKMEQCFHNNKEVGELQKLHRPQKIDKYHNVTAKVNTSLREHKSLETDHNVPLEDKLENQLHLKWKSSAPTFKDKNNISSKKLDKTSVNKNVSVKLKGREHHGTNKKEHNVQKTVPPESNLIQGTVTQSAMKYKNQGIQTLDEKHIDDLYWEGVIRYPTKSDKNKGRRKSELGPQTDDEHFRELQESPPADRGDTLVPDNTSDNARKHSKSPLPADEIDFIKLNKQQVTVANKIATQLNNGVPPASYRKGVVPKYLKERKEAHEKEQKAKAEALNSDCPEGHIALPDDERKETLRMLKKNYQDYIKELNMMPIKSDTLRAQRRKMEIEKQLTKLEDGIKVFSKPKVYVKINA